jgi:hypothetical protein
MPQKPSLIFCIIMDALGCATYLIPGLGEWFDVGFAPISAIIYFVAFKGVRGMVGGSVNFLEELLPGTDIIPTFTITWLLMRYNKTGLHKVIK